MTVSMAIKRVVVIIGLFGQVLLDLPTSNAWLQPNLALERRLKNYAVFQQHYVVITAVDVRRITSYSIRVHKPGQREQRGVVLLLIIITSEGIFIGVASAVVCIAILLILAAVKKGPEQRRG